MPSFHAKPQIGPHRAKSAVPPKGVDLLRAEDRTRMSEDLPPPASGQDSLIRQNIAFRQAVVNVLRHLDDGNIDAAIGLLQSENFVAQSETLRESLQSWMDDKSAASGPDSA